MLFQLYLYLDNMFSGQFACKEWGEFNKDFYKCTEDLIRAEILKNEFNCTTVWWEEFFPQGTRECDLKKDYEEIIQQR